MSRSRSMLVIAVLILGATMADEGFVVLDRALHGGWESPGAGGLA